MFEFIGILSVDPLLVHHDHTSNGSELDSTSGLPVALTEENVAEIKAHHPPPSLVPRLHCIVAYKLAHSNPLLPRNLEIPVPLNGNLHLNADCSKTRQFLTMYMCKINIFCVYDFKIFIHSGFYYCLVCTIDVSDLYETVLSVRSSIIDLLTMVLMGDKLAAEYTLLNLMSAV